MGLSGLTFVLTDDCNFRCSYCYQRRGRSRLDLEAAVQAFDLFLPSLDRECSVNFYGGEPLLAAGTMSGLVGHIRRRTRGSGKKVSFSLATNGSLLTDDVLRFLERHRFSVLLSFDGHAQDACRRVGSFGPTAAAIGRLLERPNIRLETNSVFTPGTVHLLAASIRLIAGLGVPSATISLSKDRAWPEALLARLERQLSDLRRFLRPRLEQTGTVPVTNFLKPEGGGVFGCAAGRDRLAVSPDGRIWGCYFYYDYARRNGRRDGLGYCFGTLDDFARAPRERYLNVLRSYDGLNMRAFWTDRGGCASCPDVQDCVVCPVDAAFSSGMVGRIAPTDCRVRRIFREQRRRFWQGLEGSARRSRPPARPPSGPRAEA